MPATAGHRTLGWRAGRCAPRRPNDPDEDALVERLKAGDMTGMKYADDLDDAYRSTG
ncbi:hypothetical protein [Embleya sp. NPDC005575]|uniref:hypothetical protein n=1 Tax=Embleya sp. NPDC005575 TaxID=3156892 RepID=UPI0033A16136